jgi:hypothetical protein
MRRVDAVVLDHGPVVALVGVCERAARLLHDSEAARLAVALAALAASGQPSVTVEPRPVIVLRGFDSPQLHHAQRRELTSLRGPLP